MNSRKMYKDFEEKTYLKDQYWLKNPGKPKFHPKNPKTNPKPKHLPKTHIYQIWVSKTQNGNPEILYYVRTKEIQRRNYSS